jgi:hypothetical protein
MKLGASAVKAALPSLPSLDFGGNLISNGGSLAHLVAINPAIILAWFIVDDYGQ